MKFLHTADLHLDSAFCGMGAMGAERCRERQRALLSRIFELADTEKCDMILIAGDLFDTVYVTPETKQLCLELFSRFAKPIVIAPGNHDPLVNGGFYKSAALPENVYVFSSGELQYFDFPELDTTVAGYAFTAAAMPKDPLADEPITREENGELLLLCAHADLDIPTSRYAPVLLSDITRHGFDYAALGHVHNPSYISDTVRYSGFPEGRSFDEEGDGGVYTVTLDGVSAPEVVRHVLSEVRYIRTELSVDGMATADDITAAIEQIILSHTGTGIVHMRLELVGVIPPAALPDLAAIEEKEREGLGSLELTDATLCIPDADYLEKDTTLRGEFYRTLRPKLYSDDREERLCALRALQIGLSAIEGKSFTDGGAL